MFASSIHLNIHVLIFSCGRCATNLTLCEHESLVLLYPILPLANQLLLASSVNVATKIQLSWMIGNIGTDCNDCRKVLIDTGCIHSMLLLIDHLQSFTNEQAKVLFWSLCNCTRSIPQDYRHLLDIGTINKITSKFYFINCVNGHL